MLKQIAVFLCLATAAAAQPAIKADRPWARATAPHQTVGGVYLTLTSPTPDRLIGASSPIAGTVEPHEMQMSGDVMRMRPMAAGLPLPPGQAAALTPGGYHLMLMDLKQPLIAGQTFPLRLEFEHAPPLDVNVTVGAVGARGPAPLHEHH